MFEGLKIVKEIPMDGVRYYELRLFGKKPLHIHFKCIICNDIKDIDITEIIVDYIKLNQKVEKMMDMEVNDANITLLGLCKECKYKGLTEMV